MRKVVRDMESTSRWNIYLKWILEWAADVMEKGKILHVEAKLKSWEKINFHPKKIFRAILKMNSKKSNPRNFIIKYLNIMDED